MKDLGNSIDELRKTSPSKGLISLIESFSKHQQEQIDEENKESYDPETHDFGSDFDYDFGGRFYLIENEEDLKEIKTTVYDKNLNIYKDITQVSAAFDNANELDNGAYVLLFLATNNAGGNSYLIPNKFIQKYPTISESVLKTHEEYGRSEDDDIPF